MKTSVWKSSPTIPVCRFASFFFMIVTLVTAAAEAGPVRTIREVGRVGRGECLFTSLQKIRIPSASIQQVVRLLSPHMDFRRIRPDAAYRIVIDPRGELQEFTIEAGSDLLHTALKRNQYVVRRWKVRRTMELDTVRGEYDLDLETAIRAAGEAGELARRFEDVLSRDMDQEIGLQKGDQFRLVVEKILGGGWLLRYGHIEAFEWRRGGSVHLAIRYGDGYYDDTGRSLKAAFLNVPLHYQYVSSEFRKKRRHPILGGVRPHRGIDLVAPLGTPVWAIADGRVVTAGWLSGFGRTVILRHAHGYESLYGHLSGFGPGVRKGAAVRQKQVIGYIGTTGLSTGPHLHFGLTRHGEYRDPLKEVFPRPSITDKAERRDFMAKKEMIVSILAADH